MFGLHEIERTNLAVEEHFLRNVRSTEYSESTEDERALVGRWVSAVLRCLACSSLLSPSGGAGMYESVYVAGLESTNKLVDHRLRARSRTRIDFISISKFYGHWYMSSRIIPSRHHFHAVVVSDKVPSRYPKLPKLLPGGLDAADYPKLAASRSPRPGVLCKKGVFVGNA